MNIFLGIVVAASLAVHASPPCDNNKLRPIWILDGDTFIAVNQEMPFRLWGVDAPELDQPWGNAASAALVAMIHKKHVRYEIKGKSHGRPVVRIWLGNRDVALELLKMGLSWYEPEYAPNMPEYQQAFDAARKDRRGLWSDTNPIRPTDFRKARKEDAIASR